MKDNHNKQLNEILYLRPLLIIGVIIGHCFAIYSGAWINSIGIEIVPFYKYVSAFFIHMGPFVMISGYLYAYKKEKYQKQGFSAYVLSKFLRLYLPALFFGIIYILLFSAESFFNYNSIIKILKGVGHLWFLPMLFFVLLLLKLGQKLIDKCPIISLIACFVLFLVSSFLKIGFVGIIFHYLPFLVLGYLLYGRTKYIQQYVFCILPLWCVIYWLITCSTPMLETIFSVISCFVFLGLAIRFSQNRTPSLFIKKLNKLSFGAYIFQQYIIMFLLYRTSLHLYINEVWLPIILILISLPMSFFFSKIFLETKFGEFLLG